MHMADVIASRLAAVLEVHALAFGRDDGARLVADLLRDPTARPARSLLAEVGSEAVGHVLVTAVSLEPGAAAGAAGHRRRARAVRRDHDAAAVLVRVSRRVAGRRRHPSADPPADADQPNFRNSRLYGPFSAPIARSTAAAS